jgi:hypothetical protein
LWRCFSGCYTATKAGRGDLPYKVNYTLWKRVSLQIEPTEKSPNFGTKSKLKKKVTHFLFH